MCVAGSVADTRARSVSQVSGDPSPRREPTSQTSIYPSAYVSNQRKQRQRHHETPASSNESRLHSTLAHFSNLPDDHDSSFSFGVLSVKLCWGVIGHSCPFGGDEPNETSEGLPCRSARRGGFRGINRISKPIKVRRKCEGGVVNLA